MKRIITFRGNVSSVNMSSRRDGAGRERLRPGPEPESSRCWSEAGLWPLWLDVLVLIYQLAGLQFGDVGIWCWENRKALVWINRTDSAHCLTPGSIAKTIRRLDLDDDCLRRADLGLLVSTPAQRASYGLLKSPFLRKEYSTLVFILKGPPHCVNRTVIFKHLWHMRVW